MPERIYKLQPNRTLHLRGFDDLGAAAALHSATATSFQVSGIFRDAADFAVLILHDADNFYEHPRLKYLPNFNFAGLTLSFDVQYEGLMPLDSPKYPTIDWPFLDVIRTDGSTARVRLFDNATQVGGTYTSASTSFTVIDSGLKQYDRVTLWYLNYAFDYVVPQLECSFVFTGQGVGTLHWVRVDGTQYQTTELANDTNTSITTRLTALISASGRVTATQVAGNQIDIRNKAGDGVSYLVEASSGGSATLTAVSAQSVAAALAAQISGANYSSALFPLAATASGTTIYIQTTRPGVDGNSLAMYATSKNSRLRAETAGGTFALLTGGSSAATWRVTIDFSALNIAQARMMWLTFAPPLVYGQTMPPTEWQATFTNWTLTGPEAVKALSVAGPDSVRVEETDSWCSYSGIWSAEEGFFSKGYARFSDAINDTVTVRYSCAATHDLYIGTSLYSNRGRFGVRLDGDAETDLDCFLINEPAVNTRRRVRSSVPPGEHTVVLRHKTAGRVYFDFLEAAVVGDVPDAMPAVAAMSPALDYSTDHTYKLSPSRLMWSFDKLGFAAPINEYLGVFWWNQRKRTGAVVPSLTLSFAGGFVNGDAIFVNIGGQVLGKSVIAGEDAGLFATHFAAWINGLLVGVFAEATGPTVKITSRSPKTAFQFTFTAWVDQAVGSTGSVSWTGALDYGVVGRWEIDETAATTLNRGARDWHANLYAECAARSREVTTAVSMELVNPPSSFAARFPDGTPVETSIGFASLVSTHCAFSSPVLAFHKSLFAELAALQSAAGLTPSLQMGEFVWWFFTNWSSSHSSGGMAFYDAETTAAAASSLGRPLHRFLRPTDNPGGAQSPDATFLRNRLRDYATAIQQHVRATRPTANFEILYPYDVNHPQPAGVHQLGGALNRFVNLPVEWESKAGSGFDRFKLEALDFGAWSRDLNLVQASIQFARSLNWPVDSVRYLVPVFRAAGAWQKEYLLARAEGIGVVNFWAFDHLCLHNLDVREPRWASRWHSW